MKLTRPFLDVIVAKQLKWYQYIQRMERIVCQQIMTWYPIWRKKRKGRPKTALMDGINGMMGEMWFMD